MCSPERALTGQVDESQKRISDATHSTLEIEQLGHIRRAALLDRFGSVSAIRKASLVEIAATPGIGEKIASIIWNHLSHMGESAVSGGVDMQTGEILEN